MSDAPKSTTITSNDELQYRALVVDSGPIIRLTGMVSLRDKAKEYYTVPAVMQEIRDARARQHLQQLPFALIVRECSSEGMTAVVEFARQTGDYPNLSSVDLQVLALQYDLEREGCRGDMTHVRKTPKRTLGVGKIVALQKEDVTAGTSSSATGTTTQQQDQQPETTTITAAAASAGVSFFQTSPSRDQDDDDDDGDDDYDVSSSSSTSSDIFDDLPAVDLKQTSAPMSWATRVNPSARTAATAITTVATGIANPTQQTNKPADVSLEKTFGTMKVSFSDSTNQGQFSDAESDSEDDDDDESYDSKAEVSDEDCDVYIMDPDEAEERQIQREQNVHVNEVPSNPAPAPAPAPAPTVQDELESDFPSLSAAMHVLYDDGSDNEAESGIAEQQQQMGHHHQRKNAALVAKEEFERKRQEALLPVTNPSGELYNSFRKYGDIVKAQGIIKQPKGKVNDTNKQLTLSASSMLPFGVDWDGDDQAGAGTTAPSTTTEAQQSSRIMGGMNMSGQGTEVEDDGEGWVTCAKDIRTMKAAGALDPSRNPNDTADKPIQGQTQRKVKQGPPIGQRTACTTTDFAMQNVILQMNLELLSVDGIKIRRLKSWVTRCGACFVVYADNDDNGNSSSNIGGARGMKRMFCSRCGSDMMQRVAASVDGKTGRLRLHLSKKYKNNLRGTKFSLPKAGTNNRFQGDLLLREDQLLYGAWNQKAKNRGGAKLQSSQSIFGSDLASNVGCNADLKQKDQLKVGFGTRNPNASKHGRERRGKKKKSGDKACGLRRY